MPPVQPSARFSLADVESAAIQILQAGPDPIPAYRLLNEVLRRPIHDADLQRAKALAAQDWRVRQLMESQLPDGSWGRFHTQDTQVKSNYRTSEEAIDRAFSLGLQKDDLVLTRAAGYIKRVLSGEAQVTDRVEKNEAWPLLIKFILAGRLAALQGRWPAYKPVRWPQIEPGNSLLDDYWAYLAEVARQAFSSGQYQLEDEALAYSHLSNLHVPQGFIESKHALWLLSSKPLPIDLEQRLVEWIWNKPDGIRYLRAPLSDLKPRLIAYWLRSMDILTRFPSWGQICGELLDRLWEQRDQEGYWDFGQQIARCSDFPLSENWRGDIKRKVDYSTCILVLLRRYFD